MGKRREQLADRALGAYLKSLHPTNMGFLDRLKVLYRPYVCPFDDLLALVPRRARVYDLGCGNGSFLALVARYRAPRMVGGSEISPVLVRNAKRLLKKADRKLRAEITVFDGKNIPRAVRGYDMVFLIDVIHHVPPAQQYPFLRRLVMMMRPGAMLVLKDIDAERRILARCNKLHDLVFSREIGHELRSDVVRRFLQRFGKVSAIAKRRMFIYPHYTILLRKGRIKT
jgi:2-polyprenyl-3-methyl-5-hydroxy-6-metoxy-1,4-benzoquinol methylase